jgi:hypothetical protein
MPQDFLYHLIKRAKKGCLCAKNEKYRKMKGTSEKKLKIANTVNGKRIDKNWKIRNKVWKTEKGKKKGEEAAAFRHTHASGREKLKF